MVWKRSDRDEDTPTQPMASPSRQPASPAASAARSGGATGSSLIGGSLRIDGEVTGDQDLTIDGTVTGKVALRKNSVTIGKSGTIKADVHASSIRVLGTVKGDLFGGSEVVVEAGGSVEGNIRAPRVVLQDGCKFKGSIDMEPPSPSRAAAPSPPARPEKGSAAGSSPAAPASASGEKSGGSN